MAIVDFGYYKAIYLGQEADEASFPALEARAEDVIGAMTHWQVTNETIANFPALVRTLYKKALCAQTDFFAVNGLETIAGSTGTGYTVGKVSVNGKSGSDLVRKGAMADFISPLALACLEQTGLMNPSVPVAPALPL